MRRGKLSDVLCQVWALFRCPESPVWLAHIAQPEAARKAAYRLKGQWDEAPGLGTKDAGTSALLLVKPGQEGLLQVRGAYAHHLQRKQAAC